MKAGNCDEGWELGLGKCVSSKKCVDTDYIGLQSTNVLKQKQI